MKKLKKIKLIFQLIRVNQWIKNTLVFAPLLFSLQFNYFAWVNSILAFIVFSTIASCIYIVNDIFDLESDKKHFRKKLRPLASKKISKMEAIVILLILLFFAIAISFKMPANFIYIISGYFLMNLLYSKWLKKIPIIDVMSIAIGFVMRVLAGAAATAITVSPWIILCTFFGALLIGFGKRKNEIDILKEDSYAHRNVLLSYERNFLNQLIALTSGITIMSYALYAINEETVMHFKTTNLIYTIPFVVFGVFRYFQIIYTSSSGEDPSKIFIKDWPMFINLLLWALTFGVIVN